MKLARLHRRLASAMALAALAAFAAGDGVGPAALAAAAALVLSVLWLPGQGSGAWIERATRLGIVALFGWMAYGAVVLGHDFMPGVMSMLLFLLAGEALRPLEARNDMRLYSLSFALLIAATAFYPGLAFAFGFVAYVGLTVLAMMVGYLRRETERFRGGAVRIGRGFLWTTVALSGVTLAMSAGVFLLFPRLPRAWSVQGRRGGGGEVAGFSDRVSIGDFGGRIGSNPEVMFRVEFPTARRPTRNGSTGAGAASTISTARSGRARPAPLTRGSPTPAPTPCAGAGRSAHAHLRRAGGRRRAVGPHPVRACGPARPSTSSTASAATSASPAPTTPSTPC